MERCDGAFGKQTFDLGSDMVAVVLAGGRGERLGALTERCAKPAMSFGGGRRVIDFSLSNCARSGIRGVAVLTQYQSASITRHLHRAWCGAVTAWDAADYGRGGRYAGTADSVFCNLDNLRRRAPRWVLVLAGDHVYHMDYRQMLEGHLRSAADLTVSCIEVPLDEASHYGVVHCDAEERIVGFKEKPARPVPVRPGADRALASMGIYLFDFDVLREALRRDAMDAASSHDFGKDVIPRLIGSHHVHAHRFHRADGSPCYWRDIGNPDAYFQTSMTLLEPGSELDAGTPQRARTAGFDGTVVHSVVGPRCAVTGGFVVESVLADDVRVRRGAKLNRCVVQADVEIGEGCRLVGAIVASGCRVPPGTRIGVPGIEDDVPCDRTPTGLRVLSPGSIALARHQSLEVREAM